jgi:hypothetical protein
MVNQLTLLVVYYSTVRRCENAPQIANANAPESSELNGTTLVYTCKTGFAEAVASYTLTCVDGSWGHDEGIYCLGQSYL